MHKYVTLNLFQGRKGVRCCDSESSSKRRASFAFTLAEVLITLGIIGVVAALTIHSLIQDSQEKEYLSAFRKAHSDLSQAYISAVQENGNIDGWSVQDTYNNIKPYFKVINDCNNTLGCFAPYYPTINGVSGGSSSIPASFAGYRFVTTTGATFGFGGGYDTISKTVSVDTNGLKGPNKFGYDYFYFILNIKNDAPYVSGYDTYWANSPDFCDKSASHGWTNGGSCALWIIRHGNMDYLHRTVTAAEW